MRWSDFVTDGGEVASLAEVRLRQPGVVLLVTTRADGTGRLSPCEPFFFDGELWLTMMHRSKKARDLERDPRVLVHSIVTDRLGDEGEVKLRGTAVREVDPSRVSEMCLAVGREMPYQPEPERVELFRVDVTSVAAIAYEGGDQHVALWPQRRRFVRPLESATSVGEPVELSWDTPLPTR